MNAGTMSLRMSVLLYDRMCHLEGRRLADRRIDNGRIRSNPSLAEIRVGGAGLVVDASLPTCGRASAQASFMATALCRTVMKEITVQAGQGRAARVRRGMLRFLPGFVAI